ncbi:hypothetical protein [Roseisolibacter agri]|uniref:Uncharacterized protein n=1 Tax=Roseisolibacter agri TaxID=2014610 RepID=A0AA37QA01_9BACT|nr:hypothetical protein [Roseisolibacter agri]GLC25086.1 hypothetical protein rosag_15990 [Roseisolibacter agri]
MDQHRFATAIGALRERTSRLLPSQLEEFANAVEDFCDVARATGQSHALVRAIIELQFARDPKYAAARDRSLAAVDECLADLQSLS